MATKTDPLSGFYTIDKATGKKVPMTALDGRDKPLGWHGEDLGTPGATGATSATGTSTGSPGGSGITAYNAAGQIVPTGPSVPGAIPQGNPALPSYLSPTSSANLKSGIDWLLNPNPDLSEVDTRAAEKALGGGYSGSNFGNLGRYLMRDSEKIRRLQLGQQLLQPYQEREFQAAESTKAQNAAMQQAVLVGQQAMERLKLSEAGETARLTQAEEAAMKQLIEQGKQAGQRLTQELANRTALSQAEIQAKLQQQAMGDQAALGRTLVSEVGKTTPANGGSGITTAFDWASGTSHVINAPQSGAGTSVAQDLLSRYLPQSAASPNSVFNNNTFALNTWKY